MSDIVVIALLAIVVFALGFVVGYGIGRDKGTP